ncbi:MAG: branched-chain amino acid ABC transporter permease [Planctomycetota bacterium]
MIDLVFHLLVMIMIYSMVLAGQQIMLFRCGVLTLSSAGFFALGGYFSAWFSTSLNIPVPLAVGLSASVCFAFGFGIGAPIFLRLKGDFLALATLMLSQLVVSILKVGGMGGASGYAGVPPLPKLLGGGSNTYQAFVYVAGVFVLGAICLRCLWQSRLGLLADAAKTDPSHLQSRGHSPARIFIQFFAISALLAGLGGALQAHYLGVIEPSMASINSTVVFLSGGIIAGGKTSFGSLLGALVIVVGPELLQNFRIFEGVNSWMAFPIAKIGFAILVIALAFIFFRKPTQATST